MYTTSTGFLSHRAVVVDTDRDSRPRIPAVTLLYTYVRTTAHVHAADEQSTRDFESRAKAVATPTIN